MFVVMAGPGPTVIEMDMAVVDSWRSWSESPQCPKCLVGQPPNKSHVHINRNRNLVTV
jgi:hypothetical protein